MREKKKTVISLIAFGVLLLLSLALVFFLKARSETPPEIRQGSVETRTISRPVTASGHLRTEDSEKLEFVCGVVMKNYLVTNGTVVKKDDPVASVDRESVSVTLKRLSDQLGRYEFEERQFFYGNYTVDDAGTVTVGNQKMNPSGLNFYLRFLDDMERAKKIEEQISYLSKCLKAGALLATADGMIHTLTFDTIAESCISRNDDVMDGRELNKITLCEIIPVAVMKATVNLDERVVLNIQEGQKVTLDVPAVGKTDIPGTVSRISCVGNPGVAMGKFEVAIDVDNDGSLFPGMTVIVRITAEEKKDVAAIRLTALDNIRGEDVLYTACDAKTGTLSSPVAVELGISDGDYAELLGGLDESSVFYYYPHGSDELIDHGDLYESE